MYDEKKVLTNAFRADSFPCNPIPFATALANGVRENGTAWISSDEAKALLLVLNQQSYGQLAAIDTVEEWDRLNKSIPK